jgi:hypothetical protein
MGFRAQRSQYAILHVAFKSLQHWAIVIRQFSFVDLLDAPEMTFPFWPTEV